MAGTTTIYASIGNSDDKLAQARWSEFHGKFTAAVRGLALQVYGDWVSSSTDPWQNACIAFEIGNETSERLQRDLAELAAEYDQDSIAWAEADTKFITPTASAGSFEIAPNTLADDVLNWVRENCGIDNHARGEALIISHDADGAIRIVKAPDDVAFDITLLRNNKLAGITFNDGVLTIEAENETLRYRPLCATDRGFVIVFRREQEDDRG
jgi:hypothetical protein